MSLEVTPDGLRIAAGTVALLPSRIDAAPALAAAPPAGELKGSAVGAALGESDPSSLQAKNVLKARFNHFAGILALSAETYVDTDNAAATRIAEVADLNAGGK